MAKSTSSFLGAAAVTLGARLFAVVAAIFALTVTHTFAQEAPAPAGSRPVRTAIASPKVDLGTGGPGEAMNTYIATSQDASAILRIGVPAPSVEFCGAVERAAEAVQTTLITTLQGDGIEVVPLNARVPILVTREAQQQRVDYIVTAALTRKGGGSRLSGKVRRGATTVGAVTPGLGALSDKVNAAVAVTAALQTVSALDGSVQAKDTIKLRYELQKGDGVLIYQGELEARAKGTGEAIIQPLLRQVAAQVTDMVITSNERPATKPSR